MLQKRSLKNILLILAGCIVFALSFALFLEPCLIAPGGVSGLGMAVNYLTGFPLGTTILCLNLPLLLLGWYKFGNRFMATTVLATVLSSLLIDLGTALLPAFTDDLLLASLYGGVLLGAGMGLVFLGGATTGGSDILGKLLRLRWPQIRMGRMVLLVDVVIVTLCALVFRNINLALYAAITLYVSAIVIDAILYGSDPAVLTYVISEKAQELGDAISEQLERGVTYLSGTGGFTGSPKLVVLCVVRRGESAPLGELVHQIDPAAFMVVCEAHQVYGFGFSPFRRESGV